MADKQIIEKYLDVGYLQKKVQETSSADYRTKFEASFDSLDPSMQDSVKKALEYAHYLPDLQQQAFSALIAYAAFAASDVDREQALSGLVPPDYKLDGPVENQDPKFAAVQHDALLAFREAQKARKGHPGDSADSRRAAFLETMSSISKHIGQGDLFNSGIPLVTGAPRPSDVPVEAQQGGRFGGVYLSTPSSALAYAFGEAAKAVNNLKVNSLTPGLAPQKHVGEGANALEQADLSPALEQSRRLLRTAEVSKNVPGIGNSQVPA